MRLLFKSIVDPACDIVQDDDGVLRFRYEGTDQERDGDLKLSPLERKKWRERLNELKGKERS